MSLSKGLVWQWSGQLVLTNGERPKACPELDFSEGRNKAPLLLFVWVSGFHSLFLLIHFHYGLNTC